MNRFIFHGELEERYGQPPPMDVRDVAEAMRAFACQLPGFLEVIKTKTWLVLREFADGTFALDVDSLLLGMDGSTVHLMPELEGAASSNNTGKGVGKTILGIALIAASFFIPGGFIVAGIHASALAVGIGMAGATLAFAGASMLLAPQVSDTTAQQDAKNSFVFSGPTGTSGQGMAVPPVYGKMRVGSVPVATKVVTNETNVSDGIFDNTPVIAVASILPINVDFGTIGLVRGQNWQPYVFDGKQWNANGAWDAVNLWWVMSPNRIVYIEGTSKSQTTPIAVGSLTVRPPNTILITVDDGSLQQIATVSG